MKIINYNNKRHWNPILNILIFILWPLGGFLYSLLNINSKLSKYIFISFFFFVGCSFKLTDSLYDSFRYADDYLEHIYYNDLNIRDIFSSLFSGEITDVYQYIMAYVTSFVSNSPRILYGFYGLVWGFSVYYSILYTRQEWKQKMNRYVLFILLVLFFINPYVNINGVRFWTATWLFFCSWLGFFEKKRKVWLAGLIIVPFMHYSFVILLPLIILSILLKDKIRLLLIISYISFLIVPYFDISYTFSTDVFGSAIGSHVGFYIDPDYMATVSNQKNERSISNMTLTALPEYFIFIFLLFSYKYISNIREDKRTSISFSIFLVLFIFLNLTSVIPSVERFRILLYMFFLYNILLFYEKDINKKTQWFLNLLIPVFIGTIFVTYTIHDDVLSPIYLYKSTFSIVDFALSYIY